VPSNRAFAIFFCRTILGLIFFKAGVYECLVMTLYQFHTHVIPRLALWSAALLLPREEDTIFLDRVLRRRG